MYSASEKSVSTVLYILIYTTFIINTEKTSFRVDSAFMVCTTFICLSQIKKKMVRKKKDMKPAFIELMSELGRKTI